MINWNDISDPRRLIERDTSYAAKDMYESWKSGKTGNSNFYGWLDVVFMIDWENAYTSDTEVDVERTPAIY